MIELPLVKEICMNCRWWLAQSRDDNYQTDGCPKLNVGSCKRYPPKQTHTGKCYSPVTYHDNFCGEFKEREPVETKPLPKPKRIPFEEIQILVRDWISTHAHGNLHAITCVACAAACGVSTRSVIKTTAWKAFIERRDAEYRSTW